MKVLISLLILVSGFSFSANAKMSHKQMRNIMMCLQMEEAGMDIPDGIGGACYAGIGGPMHAGIGGPLYAGIGGNCHAGIGGACYAGIGGNCHVNSYSSMDDLEKCPIQCYTVCR